MKDFKDVLKQMRASSPKLKGEIGDRIADELQLRSNKEVPHDEGTLQASWQVTDIGDGAREVGYHTVYAARLHEHPAYRFRKGRKGKFLEDPIKNNRTIWEKIIAQTFKEALSAI